MSCAISSPCSAAVVSSSSPAERTALARLRQSYQAGISRGETTDALAPLARQIAAAAQKLGQNVSLPKPDVAAATAQAAIAAPVAQAAIAASVATSLVDLHA